MSWNLPDTISFNAPNSVPSMQIEDADNKKKLFGVELAKGKKPFEAALEVCGQATNQALYISQHWMNDEIVLKSKEEFLKAVHNPQNLLGADELAAKLLRMAEEKDRSNSFYMLEGKDRLAALKLYAEVKGFIGKNATEINNNISFKQITVKFVKPKEAPVIDETPSELPNSELDANLNTKSIPKLKLVS